MANHLEVWEGVASPRSPVWPCPGHSGQPWPSPGPSGPSQITPGTPGTPWDPPGTPRDPPGPLQDPSSPSQDPPRALPDPSRGLPEPSQDPPRGPSRAPRGLPGPLRDPSGTPPGTLGSPWGTPLDLSDHPLEQYPTRRRNRRHVSALTPQHVRLRRSASRCDTSLADPGPMPRSSAAGGVPAWCTVPGCTPATRVYAGRWPLCRTRTGTRGTGTQYGRQAHHCPALAAALRRLPCSRLTPLRSRDHARITRPSIFVRNTGEPSSPIRGRAQPGCSPGCLFKPADCCSLILLPARRSATTADTRPHLRSSFG